MLAIEIVDVVAVFTIVAVIAVDTLSLVRIAPLPGQIRYVHHLTDWAMLQA